MAARSREWLELRVEEIGRGPPLLLVMGLGASLETWVAQREAFAARHRVILFDNRGAGGSEMPPPPWTVPDMAADAVGVLDALGIARAHVLGVSMGGMIAQEIGDRLARAGRSRLVVAVSFARPDPAPARVPPVPPLGTPPGRGSRAGRRRQPAMVGVAARS